MTNDELITLIKCQEEIQMSKINFIVRSVALLDTDKRYNNYNKHQIAEMVWEWMQKNKREIKDFEFKDIVSQCERFDEKVRGN
jgi:hypothetical protein